MSFWDRFILVIYNGFAEHIPVGRDAAARLFAEAYRRGRLLPSNLNDLSILLLLAILPKDSPLRAPAEQEALGRNLHLQPGRVWALLHRFRPPRLLEVIEIARTQGSALVPLRLLVARLFTTANLAEVYANLLECLSRACLAESAIQEPAAQQLVFRALKRYLAIPVGTVDYLCLLYQEVATRLFRPGQTMPSVLPGPPFPGWFTALDPPEQGLVQRCLLHLPEPDLGLLYLQLYARLSAHQIAGVLRWGDPTITADQVAQHLEQIWYTIL